MRFKPPEEKWRVQLAASCLTVPDRVLVLDAPNRTLDYTGLDIFYKFISILYFFSFRLLFHS